MRISMRETLGWSLSEVCEGPYEERTLRATDYIADIYSLWEKDASVKRPAAAEPRSTSPHGTVNKGSLETVGTIKGKSRSMSVSNVSAPPVSANSP